MHKYARLFALRTKADNVQTNRTEKERQTTANTTYLLKRMTCSVKYMYRRNAQ